METSTINQLIESAGIIFIARITLKTYSKAVKWKRNVNREIELLKDLIFFRTVEQKYLEVTSDKNGGSGFLKIRKTVQKELDYNTSTNNEPARIKRNLEKLKQYDDSIDEFISKITIK